MATRKAYFYNSSGGDRLYNADSMIDWLTPFFTTGVFNNNFRVVSTGAMSVTIEGGYCNIQGRVMHQWDSDVLDIPVASGNLSRIDIAVIRRDDVTRDIYPMIISGGFSQTPTRPALVRENGLYDIQLAEWIVKPGVIAISQIDITDTRMDKDLCGWVVGTVPQVDFSQIYAQFTEFFTSYKAQITGEYDDYVSQLNASYQAFLQWAADTQASSDAEADDFTTWIDTFERQSSDDYTQWYNENTAEFTTRFNDWFQSIQDALDGDIATNLANSILALQTRATAIEAEDTAQDARITAVEEYISDNLTFSTEAWIGKSYIGTAYVTNEIT